MVEAVQDGRTDRKLSDPLVSIGMPVYNAERHLREAIEALLAQDHSNIELIISDNASTDGTGEICRDYARRDSRVLYSRSELNFGAVWNFNRVFELAQGSYFMWAAHDDVRAHNFVSACVAAMQLRPEAGLCCTEVAFMDEDGADVKPWTALIHPTGPTPRSRVSAIARSRYWLDVYGLMRRDLLASTTLAQPVWGFDVSILLQMCLRGPVLMVDERLFHYRVETTKTVQTVASTLGKPESRGAIEVNWSALVLELLSDVRRSPLPALTRAGLTVQLLIQMCVFNGLVGSGVRSDVVRNMRSAWGGRRPTRVLLLGLMAALTFPIHNRLIRSVVRRSG